MLKQTGYTLIELLITLTLSSVSIVATTGLLATTTTHSFRLEQVSRLHDELNLIVSVLTEDIQKAGYDEFATQRLMNTLLPPSPFTSSLNIDAFADETRNSCITFAHDINANGELNVRTPNERRGYRLRDGAIEVRMSGRRCDQSGWQDLTSTDFIVINHLRFSQNTQKQGPLTLNTITLEISASLATDKHVRRRIRTKISVNNINA